MREVLYKVWKRSHVRWCFIAMCEMLLGSLRIKEQSMNFRKKKTQKIISSIIILILVLAMIVPTLLSFL